jgi:deoxyribonuclease V
MNTLLPSKISYRSSNPGRISLPHPWNLDPEEAAGLQTQLAGELKLTWDGRPVRTVAGVDGAYPDEQGRAAIVVLRYPDLSPLVTATAEQSPVFPYILGLLVFREGPVILAAWEKLLLKPVLLLFDGQGIAHPRLCVIASHLGLWLGIPTIGVAKSRLYGRHGEVGLDPGDWSELRDEHDPQQVIGGVLRTRRNSKPLYISSGHLIDLEHALVFTLACCLGYRLPEPIRQAHQAASSPHLAI